MTTMTSYERFGEFYDAVMGDRGQQLSKFWNLFGQRNRTQRTYLSLVVEPDQS
jgi:hypothetical protein